MGEVWIVQPANGIGEIANAKGREGGISRTALQTPFFQYPNVD